MGFSELLQALQNPGEDGTPDTIYDDLTTEYNSVVEGGAASVAERDATIATLSADIDKLKAMNFDLLIAAGEADEPTSIDDATLDEPAAPSIDELFDK